MGWERRGRGLYYYRKRREGKRVVSEYGGSGDLAVFAAELDALARAERVEDRAAERAERAAFCGLEQQVVEQVGLSRFVLVAVLEAAGYHRHRGQWRKKRDG